MSERDEYDYWAEKDQAEVTIPDDLTEWREAVTEARARSEEMIVSASELLALIDEVQTLREAVKAQTTTGIRLMDERDAALKVLRAVEWIDEDGWTICVSCEQYREEGHAPDCALAAVLRGESE